MAKKDFKTWLDQNGMMAIGFSILAGSIGFLFFGGGSDALSEWDQKRIEYSQKRSENFNSSVEADILAERLEIDSEIALERYQEGCILIPGIIAEGLPFAEDGYKAVDNKTYCDCEGTTAISMDGNPIDIRSTSKIDKAACKASL